MEGPLCDDSLSCFISVHTALSSLPSCGATLGHVLNGATVHEYEEDASTPPSPLKVWGFRMGARYETLATYTAFALGGEAINMYNEYQDGAPYQVKTAQLQVIKNGVVEKAWLLNVPLPVEELLPFCVPAAYGDLTTQTTVVDPTVRTAVELPSAECAELHHSIASESTADAERARYTFRIRWATLGSAGAYVVRDPPPQFLAEVEAAVRTKLVHANTYLMPYKVNVYGVGGFFKPHVDTPTADAARMVGTVVVALPTAFEGGVLRVRAPSGTMPTFITGAHGGAGSGASGGGASGGAGGGASGGGAGGSGTESDTAVCTFDWAPHSTDATQLQWAAFFGDCVHEVEPVTAGNRVTLTYAIIMVDEKDEDEDKDGGTVYAGDTPSIVAEASIVSQPHVACLVEAAATCPAPTFGMLLTHKYTFSGISTATLKGTDRVLHDGFVRAGWRVALRPVVYSAHVVGPYPTCGDGGVAHNVIYAFGPGDVERLRVGAKSTTVPSDWPFVRCSSAKIGRVSGDESLGLCLLSKYTAACEYTGNEACPKDDHTLYFSAALIVTRP